jgi:O-antigen/teichoic acid export membrane protein
MSDSKGLAKKTIKNAVWNYAAFASSKAIVFVTTVILARVLSPEDFGLMALGLIAINYLDILNDFGVSAALIYHQQDPERTANTAFGINMLTGLLLMVVGILIAPLIADFFHEPRVVDVVRVLSISFLISSVGAMHEARLKKDLNFRRQIIPQTGKMLAKGIVSIGLALSGLGVWSLVWGQVAGSIVASTLYWIVYRWRPRLEFDRNIARSLIGYGSQMTVAGILGEVHKNIDYVLVGRRMSSEQLGFYSLAFRLPELVIINLVVVVGQSVFPTYAKVQNDLETLRKGFLATLHYMSMLTIPFGIGMFIVAPEFVTVFYTDRWAPAIPVMQVLSLYAVVYSLSYNAGDIYKAIGRPKILNQLSIVKLAITIPVLWVAASYNIYYVALGQLITTIVLTIIRLVIVGRIVSINPLETMQAIRPAAVSAAVMLVGTLLVRSYILESEPVVRLVVLALVGAVLYVAALWFTSRETLEKAFLIVRPQSRSIVAPSKSL